MDQPKTLDTIEKRWQRRLICFAILPILIPLTVMMALAAGWAKVADAALFLRDYWRK